MFARIPLKGDGLLSASQKQLIIIMCKALKVHMYAHMYMYVYEHACQWDMLTFGFFLFL